MSVESSDDSRAEVQRLMFTMSPSVFTRTEFCFILVVSIPFVFIFFDTDLHSFLYAGLKTTFIVTLSVFALQFIVKRIIGAVHSKQQRLIKSEMKYDDKVKSSRELCQQEFDNQRESYKERILVPREETKKAKKEEEFLRFQGPAWKGRGVQLGGEDARTSASHKVQGREAAELRHLPDTSVKHSPEPKESKKKKVIVLPDEPDENAPGSLVVVLRTPAQMVHRRRFQESATIQNVLDYMTMVGFHQVGYTLSTSYPRQNLSDQSDQTLGGLGFHKQVVLNVEEKEV